MTAVALIACMAAIQTQPKITIQLFQDDFVVRQATKKSVVPLKLDQPKPPLAVVFRKNKIFAVWDDRGLSIRNGKKLVSSKLKEISVSPRIFEREEILSNLELIRQGKRSREASALSGAKRIGGDAYFLVRWDDSDGKPWLEALVKVGLDAKKPEWKLLGKFEGLSLATLPIDDKLMLHKGSLAIVTGRAADWGESFYSSELKAFGFKKLGTGLVDFTYQEGFSGLFVEKTPYGSSIGGLADFETQKRSEALEVKGGLKFLDGRSPLIGIVRTDNGTALRNARTGAEMALPASSAVRRTASGIVVWSPVTKPTRAWLYDPIRWAPLATWTAPKKP